ncbi:hypothetical protein HDZ31DRAFT_70945, partial [Schizophyllum fasciatum]
AAYRNDSISRTRSVNKGRKDSPSIVTQGSTAGRMNSPAALAEKSMAYTRAPLASIPEEPQATAPVDALTKDAAREIESLPGPQFQISNVAVEVPIPFASWRPPDAEYHQVENVFRASAAWAWKLILSMMPQEPITMRSVVTNVIVAGTLPLRLTFTLAFDMVELVLTDILTAHSVVYCLAICLARPAHALFPSLPLEKRTLVLGDAASSALAIAIAWPSISTWLNTYVIARTNWTIKVEGRRTSKIAIDALHTIP